MEKQNYYLKVYNSKNNEIDLQGCSLWYGLSLDEIKILTRGVMVGLKTKYKGTCICEIYNLYTNKCEARIWS